MNYTYDEQKQRIRKENVTQEEVTYYIDKYYDLEGEEEKAHIFAGNTKVATLEREGEDANLIYHHEDHLTGSNVDTDVEGEIVQLLDYFPYGDTRIDDHEENYNNDYQFTGKERDTETSLLYYEARYYDSSIGRFISRDPWEGDIQDPQSLNKYSYVQNNPLKYIDPNGEEKLTVVIEVSAGGWWNVGHTGISIDGDYNDYGPVSEKTYIGARGGSYWDKRSEISEKRDANLQDVLNAVRNNKVAEGHSVYTVTAEITPKQAEKIQSYWSNLDENPGMYNLLLNQCTTTVSKSLDKAGLLSTPNFLDYMNPNPFSKVRAFHNRYKTMSPDTLLDTLRDNLRNTYGPDKGKAAQVEEVSKNSNNSDDDDDD